LIASTLPVANDSPQTDVALNVSAQEASGEINPVAFQTASQNLHSSLSSLNPKQPVADAGMNAAFGFEVGVNLGALAALNSMSMASRMQPVYELSNTLLAAAKSEVDMMMRHLTAQFVQSPQGESIDPSQHVTSQMFLPPALPAVPTMWQSSLLPLPVFQPTPAVAASPYNWSTFC
jgi:hypothetical protein